MSFTCRTLSIVAVLCLAATGGSAQLVPLGPEQLLSSDPVDCALLAGAADGRFAAAWVDRNPANLGERRLQVQVVDEDDVPLPPEEISQFHIEWVELDALRSTSSGFALQWFSGFHTQGHWLRLLDHEGSPQAPTELDGLGTTSARPVAGYVDAWISWLDWRAPRGVLQVGLRNAAGAPIGRVVTLGRYATWAKVEHQPDGRFVVVYQSKVWRGGTSVDLGVRAVWFSRAGKRISRDVLVVPPGARLLGYALGADGTLAVSHGSPQQPTSPLSPLLRTFNAPRRGEAGPSRTVAATAARSLALAVDAHGSVLVAWSADFSTTGLVTAQLFAADLAPLGPPFVVSPPASGIFPYDTCVRAAAAGTSWVVSWTRAETALGRELRARRFAAP